MDSGNFVLANAMSRPADFYKEDYDTSYFDKIMVSSHIELSNA